MGREREMESTHAHKRTYVKLCIPTEAAGPPATKPDPTG